MFPQRSVFQPALPRSSAFLSRSPSIQPPALPCVLLVSDSVLNCNIMLQLQKHDVSLSPMLLGVLTKVTILQLALVAFSSTAFLSGRDTSCYSPADKRLQMAGEFINQYCRQFSLYVDNGPNGQKSVK